jgi:hypothetical protein
MDLSFMADKRDWTLMLAEFVVDLLGLDEDEGLELIKGCEEAVQEGDQWYLPLWRMEELLRVYQPFQYICG